MARPVPALVLFAVKEESRFFQAARAEASGIISGLIGMGSRNALRSTERALQKYRPDRVLTCGFAGGLNPAIPIGSVLYHLSHPDAALENQLAKAGAQPGKIVCAERVLVTQQEKRDLFSQTQADAVEMESGVVQQVCADQKIPCVTLRVILDGADEDLPLDFNALMTEKSQLDFGRLARELMASPGKIPKLLALQRRTTEAGKSLGSVLNAFFRA